MSFFSICVKDNDYIMNGIETTTNIRLAMNFGTLEQCQVFMKKII